MHAKQAKALKVGDRVVIWPNTPESATGRVRIAGRVTCTFDWDDGQWCGQTIHHDDMSMVEKLPAANNPAA